MPPSNSITISSDAFEPSKLSPEALGFQAYLREVTPKVEKWWKIGAAEARKMRLEGKSALPPPVLLPSAITFELPSRDSGRTIPCRMFKPQDGTASTPPKGIFYHIHQGGFVLMDETYQDPYLQDLANTHNLICISVRYRLAPEHPFPAGPQDCYDVAECLIEHAESKYGAPLSFISGESAGGTLSVLTILHLLQHENPKFRDFRFQGTLLHFGCYNLTFSPSVYQIGGRSDSMVVDLELLEQTRRAVVPGYTEETLRDPNNSPIYADFSKLRGKLPPALFTVGTEDMLLDDTLLMSTKWLTTGAQTRLELIPGAPHVYISFPPEVPGSPAGQGLALVNVYLSEKLKY